jgi:2-desacetyl-2-hydroxyethyl bacteriochlorophyllide A dehydrogenase
MSTKMRAIVFTAPRKVELQTFDLVKPGPDEILVENIYTFVSPGTELRVLVGLGEAKQYFPFIPGYSSVGRVIEVGKDVRGFFVGDLVSSMLGEAKSTMTCKTKPAV